MLACFRNCVFEICKQSSSHRVLLMNVKTQFCLRTRLWSHFRRRKRRREELIEHWPGRHHLSSTPSGSKRMVKRGDLRGAFESQLIFSTEMEEELSATHLCFKFSNRNTKTNVNIVSTCSVSIVCFVIVGYLSASAAKALGSNIREAITKKYSMVLLQTIAILLW